jgi:hypothetical protein
MTRAYTENEVRLCREIAERCRGRVVNGDWYVDYTGTPQLWADKANAILDVEMFKLLSLEDCIEEMERRGFAVSMFGAGEGYKCEFAKGEDYDSYTGSYFREAALMCLCEIVKGEKG